MRSWRFLLGLLISGAFLFYAFHGQDYGAIADALRGVRYWMLIPALGLYFLGVTARAYRWHLLLSPVKKISTRSLMPITAIGFMANNILPLRMGEVVRSFVLNKNHGVKKSSALITIWIERIFDGITMVGFMLIAATTIDLTSDLRHVVKLASALFAVAVVGLGIATYAEGLREKLLQFGLKFLPDSIGSRVESLAEAIFSGLGSLKSPKLMAAVTLSSITVWSLEASMYWIVAQAFGGSVQKIMGFSETLLTTGVANLATLVPSSPGYVGPFEAGIKTALNGALNVSETQALSYAILIHAWLWFPVTLWGAIEWSRMHISLKQVQGETTAVDPVKASTVPSVNETTTVSSSAAHPNAA